MTIKPTRFVCMIAYTDYMFDARVRREAETLAANGFHVRCYSLRSGPYRGATVVEGVELHQLPVGKYRGKSTLAYVFSYLRFLVLASAACAWRLVKRQLDVVHVHNIPDFLVLAGLLPRLAGRKVVLDVHDSVPETFATKFSSAPAVKRALCLEERLSAALAHRVICVNHPQRDRLVERGINASKTFVSMNVPDPRIFASGPEEDVPTSPTEGLELVYHGTMAERLGVDLIIRALAELQTRVPRSRLHLWGHGDDLPAFQRLAAELQIDRSVLFEPKGLPLRDLPRHLRTKHIGVVGNRRTVAGELMLPVKMLEYVALSIPVVVPRLRVIQHYFTDDMVTYYEPGDVGSLTEAIHRLHQHPALRIGQAARARAFLQEYGWERHGGELVRFYDSLVETGV